MLTIGHLQIPLNALISGACSVSGYLPDAAILGRFKKSQLPFMSQLIGLDKVHFTWAGSFVLEAMVYLFPDKHIILIDTDCVPTSFFKVEEIVRITQSCVEQATGVELHSIRG